MTRFVVDTGDISLSREAEAELADEIQRAVLSRVAQTDWRKPFVVQFPWEWLGIILRPDVITLEKDFDRLSKAIPNLGRG